MKGIKSRVSVNCSLPLKVPGMPIVVVLTVIAFINSHLNLNWNSVIPVSCQVLVLQAFRTSSSVLWNNMLVLKLYGIIKISDHPWLQSWDNSNFKMADLYLFIITLNLIAKCLYKEKFCVSKLNALTHYFTF